MGLILACVVRILHDDWSSRLGENIPDRVLKDLAAMLCELIPVENSVANVGYKPRLGINGAKSDADSGRRQWTQTVDAGHTVKIVLHNKEMEIKARFYKKEISCESLINLSIKNPIKPNIDPSLPFLESDLILIP